jgi:hypothetical protein
MQCHANASFSSYVRPADVNGKKAAVCASCDDDGVVGWYSTFYAAFVLSCVLAFAARRYICQHVPHVQGYWKACKPLVKLKVTGSFCAELVVPCIIPAFTLSDSRSL